MINFIDNLQNYLHGAPLLALAAVFSGGLLTSLTPCVYPMIPITASFVGSSNLGGSKWRSFWLSIIYVTGIAVTYAGMGIFAAMSGGFFGAINSNSYTFLIVGNIVLILGIGMLGGYSLPVYGKRSPTNPKGFIGVFMVGITSGFIAGPCTAPVLGVLLAFAATTGNLLYGGLLLFVFAFGMGAILIAVGTFSGIVAALPKSGAWMVRLKNIMGAGMIVMAEYFFIKAGQLLF